VHQARTGIVPAARGTRAMQDRARAHGATLRDRSPVTDLVDLDGALEVTAGGTTYRVRRVVVTADAWTNDVLAPLDHRIPLTVTQEQVTYFAPERPDAFAPGRFPVWIWMDDPSFYGFPTYGEATVKAAQDCGGPVVGADERGFEPDQGRGDLPASFVARTFPGAGAAQRSKTCLYTLTPDRDFVLGPVPGHEAVLVGLGAAHGFKFAPTLGRLLADLATTGAAGASDGLDLEPYRLDRVALTDPDREPSWLV
jgi:sarcosine oxidase